MSGQMYLTVFVQVSCNLFQIHHKALPQKGVVTVSHFSYQKTVHCSRIYLASPQEKATPSSHPVSPLQGRELSNCLQIGCDPQP